MRALSFCSAWALCALAGRALAQTTWYVDVHATPPGTGSVATPYASLQYAHDQPSTVNGDTLLVAPGTYVENVHVWKEVVVSATLGAELTHIVPASAGIVVFLDGTLDQNALTVFEGFDIASGAGTTDVVRASAGTLRRCLVRGSGSENGVNSVYDAVLESCTVTGCAQGLNATGFGATFLVTNSIVWDNANDFVTISSYFVRYSCGFASGFPPFGGSTIGSLHHTDPLFWDASAGDFHLAAGSPCIDTGDPAYPLDPDASRSDMGVFTYAASYTPPSLAFCSGDGALLDHTTNCPCGNNGATGNGCAHSFNAAGANLAATGAPALDDVVLASSGEPVSSFTLFMQHDAAGDHVFHDGVLCASGGLIRLRGRAAVAGEASFPNSAFANDSTLTLSQRGGVAVGSGTRRYYAAWFRNASTTFCPPATANVTNGWTLVW
jgi:hypothetical protein